MSPLAGGSETGAANRPGRAFTRQAVGATRARRLSASQVATATLLGQFVEAAYAMFQANPGDPTPPPIPIFLLVTSLSPELRCVISSSEAQSTSSTVSLLRV